jgi:hypothetical protein
VWIYLLFFVLKEMHGRLTALERERERERERGDFEEGGTNYIM